MARITREDRTSIQVVIPKDAKKKIDEKAAALTVERGEKVVAADVVREALEAFIDQGVDFGVTRGGDRRTK